MFSSLVKVVTKASLVSTISTTISGSNNVLAFVALLRKYQVKLKSLTSFRQISVNIGNIFVTCKKRSCVSKHG